MKLSKLVKIAFFALAAVLMLHQVGCTVEQSKPVQTTQPASMPASSAPTSIAPTGISAATAPATAPSATAQAASRPVAIVNYEGVVLDKDDKPVAGATVRAFEIVSDGWVSTVHPLGKLTTGRDGKYSFASKTMFNCQTFVVAEKEGYAVGVANFEVNCPVSGELHLCQPVTTGGTVVDDDGKGIAGARVNMRLEVNDDNVDAPAYELPGCEVMAVTTDADGKFEFKNTPPKANVSFIVTAAGKASKCDAGGRLKEGSWLTGTKDIKIILAAEGKITGVLKAKNGGAVIAGATIQAITYDAIMLADMPLAVTDKEGKFSFNALPAGEVVFRILGKNDQPAHWVVEEELFKVIAGETSNITLEAVKGGLIEVTVLDDDTDNPIAGARIDFACSQKTTDIPSFGYGITNKNGLAVVRVMPGEYSVNAEARNYDIPRLPVEVSPSVTVAEGQTAKTDVRLGADYIFEGIVKDPDGKPVADIEMIAPVHYGAYPKTDALGKFSFRCSRMEFSQDRGDGVNYILIRDAKRGLVGLAEIEGQDSKLTINLDKGIMLKGLITDAKGKPIKGAKVYAEITQDDNTIASVTKEATTDDKGRYELHNMPKDMEFRVHAEAEGYVEDQATEISLDEKTSLAVVDTIVLPEANLEISGIVKDENDKGVAGATVCVTGSEGRNSKEAVTDKEGKFTVKGLAQGEVSITVTTTENRPIESTSASAGDTDVLIVLKEGSEPKRKYAGDDDDDDSDDDSGEDDSPASQPASAPGG